MKLKVIALSLALAASVAASAQTACKDKDIFVGVGVGAASVFTPGLNTPTVYGNIMVGKYITPVWGVRGVIGGPFQTLNASNNTAFVDAAATTHYSKTNKLFGELNFDAMFNISNLFADNLAKFDVYLFAGPTLNFSSVGTKFADVQNAEVLLVAECNDFKVRAGATVGLGLAYNFTKSFALGLEGRFGVTPSIFGDADAYRKAEGTGRLALNGVWTIGGKHGKIARAATAAAAAGAFSVAVVKIVIIVLVILVHVVKAQILKIRHVLADIIDAVGKVCGGRFEILDIVCKRVENIDHCKHELALGSFSVNAEALGEALQICYFFRCGHKSNLLTFKPTDDRARLPSAYLLFAYYQL